MIHKSQTRLVKKVTNIYIKTDCLHRLITQFKCESFRSLIT